MKVLITGANGFIGKNLQIFLNERKNIEVLTFLRTDNKKILADKVKQVDFIFHLAGINRPKSEQEFEEGNSLLTKDLCEAIEISGKRVPVIYTSSIQAEAINPYGQSKKAAEDVLREFSIKNESLIYIYRLPNVFGKWCRPNYNSAVATFCYNTINNIPIQINDPAAIVQLVYVDDVIASFLKVLDSLPAMQKLHEVQPVYKITIGELATQIQAFKESRNNLITEKVGCGIIRALYSTYVSYMSPAQFSYKLTKNEDPRGMFVEFLKTKDSGQFSFFTAHPGVTRGGHYHHSKTEKFLVVKGKACFKFLHVLSGETYECFTSADSPEVVETIPGWSHDITNVGDDEMIVMLWANEVFDRQLPDTIAHKVV